MTMTTLTNGESAYVRQLMQASLRSLNRRLDQTAMHSQRTRGQVPVSHAEVFYTKIWKINRKALSLQTERIKDTIMENSFTDKIEWTLIFAMEFGRHFGLTLKQAFNYLNRFGAIKFVDDHYDYCHTQSFQSMVSDMAEYCHRKGGALV